MREINRQVVRYLCKGHNKQMDAMDKLNGSTVLHVACDLLTDLIIVETLIESGCHINPVNNDN